MWIHRYRRRSLWMRTGGKAAVAQVALYSLKCGVCDCSARIFHGVAVVAKLPPYYPVLDHFDPSMSLTEGALR